MDATLGPSISDGMPTDCTRNLSRHLASGGGSSRMACSRTAMVSAIRAQAAAGTVPCTSTWLLGSMRPELGRTQYLRCVNCERFTALR